MTKRITAVLAFIVSLVPAAFAQVDFDRGNADLKAALSAMDVPQVSAPAEQKGWFGNNDPKPQPVKEWTVMVYMNGKNDLEAAGFLDLDEMERIGSSDQVNILAEWGRMSGQEGDINGVDGDWTGSRRYLVAKDMTREKIRSKAVQKFSTVDMGDWKHLVDFAQWGMKNYPAKRYTLIVWNHGSGWKTSKTAITKGISYDFETKNHISTPELGEAMKAIGKVDILGFDACLMQMPEVAWEVKDHADFIVGSEQTIPGLGMPYDYMLGHLYIEGKAAEPEHFARMMVEGYSAFYSSQKKSTTLSILRTSEFPAFAGVFNAWTDSMLAFEKKGEIKRQYMLARKYDDEDSKDLYDFAKRVEALDQNGPLGASSREVMAALKDKLVIKSNAYLGVYEQDKESHGLAVYLPGKGYDAKYDQLAWAGASRWDEFLKEMQGVSVPGLEFMNGCTDPGPGASLQALMAYIDCLTAAIGKP